MKVLITNITLAGRSGTEIVTLNLASALKRLGHQPIVYSPDTGPIADEIRALGVPVLSDLDQLPETPDVIHGHHTLETSAAALRFPRTPAIFVCHDFSAWHDEAPKLPSIVHHVAISEGFRLRLTSQDGVERGATSVVLNGVDTHRFQLGPDLAARPRKALIFAKNTQHLEAVQAACSQIGLPADVIGAAVGRVTDQPETLVQDYDLVFTSALSAMECMAAGRAVIVCDGRGLAGFVDEERYGRWRPENFGLPVFDKALTVAAIVAEIGRYDADQARRVSTRIRNDANLSAWAQTYVDIYRKAITAFAPPEPNELSRAAARLVQRWSPARHPPAWLQERARLQDTIERLSQGMDRMPLTHEVPVIDARLISLSGFHAPEHWGAWSAKSRFAIRFRAEKPFSRMTLKGLPYLTPQRPTCPLKVAVNGVEVGARLLSEDVQSLSFDFPVVTDEVTWLDIRSDDGASPSNQGSLDSRMLGFGLMSIRID